MVEFTGLEPPPDYGAECRKIAEELRRPLCDVRRLEGADGPEVYMAGGAWLPVEMVREFKESGRNA